MSTPRCFRVAALVGLLALHAGLSLADEASDAAGEAREADAASERVITLLHLNDLHAHLVPHADLVRDASDPARGPRAIVAERGGVARLATLVQRLRARSPASILMNVGDTYHGGVEALYTRGNAVAAAVDALGIDIGVPGNWDFAYGPLVTRLRYAEHPGALPRFVNWLSGGDPVARPGYPNLAANLRQTFPPFAAGELLLPATAMLEVGGVRIGFIGLTADIVPRMARPMSWGFEFAQGESAHRALIDELTASLREKGAELVVVMSELGIHKDVQLAQIVNPGVDVFFSAHTHEVTGRPIETRSGALVVESGNDGYLGEMRVKLRPGQPPGFAWTLHTVDASIEEDPRVRAIVEAARAPFLAADVHMELPAFGVSLPLERPIDTVVGTSDVLLHRRNALENPFNAFLAEAIRRVAGTQISLTPGFRYDAVVPARSTGGEATPGEAPLPASSGEITLEQVYRYLPLAPKLATATLRVSALRAILETELSRVFSRDAFRHSGGWLGGYGGLDLELDLQRPDGERVVAIRLRGSEEPLADDVVLSAASCVRPFDDEGVLCGGSGFEAITVVDNPSSGRAWTPLEVVLNALERAPAAPEDAPHVLDRSHMPQWPESAFVQPLRGREEAAPGSAALQRFDASPASAGLRDYAPARSP